MCGEKFPLVSMGGRAEGFACADPGARTPIGPSGNFYFIVVVLLDTVVIIPEAVVVGFQIFACAPN